MRRASKLILITCRVTATLALSACGNPVGEDVASTPLAASVAPPARSSSPDRDHLNRAAEPRGAKLPGTPS